MPDSLARLRRNSSAEQEGGTNKPVAALVQIRLIYGVNELIMMYSNQLTQCHKTVPGPFSKKCVSVYHVSPVTMAE